jgi:hypothetical protein
MNESSPADELVAKIHPASGQMMMAITGGGSGAISQLLSVPGGSRTVLEAIVPYSAAALSEFLGATPDHFCSPRTARLMAMAAFQRGRRLQSVEDSPADFAKPPLGREHGAERQAAVGVGCTASLVSNRRKRGPHRIHVATQSTDRTATLSLELVKGRRTRHEEESIASGLVLNAIADEFAIDERLQLPLIEGEGIQSTCTAAPPHWRALVLGETHLAPGEYTQGNAATTPQAANPTKFIFPGAFNPLHDGHWEMAKTVERKFNSPVDFEISIENVDKPLLDYTEMQTRSACLAEKNLRLWFTRAPTFEKKSQLFPRATFIVGADTLLRIGQPRYYDNDPAAMAAAIDRIAQHGCRFLMFGRIVDGRFQSLADLQLPDALRRLVDEVPEGEFRADISSTDLRRQVDGVE